ncbi:MAG TPA: alpha/beta fold hydrolase [Rhizomicrobium sp.]|jgi:alpha-beta hydrolase superfamily lysophospholipase
MVRKRIAALFARARCTGAVALIALALARCAPELAPEGAANNVPSVTADVFITRDGLRLPLRHWDAQKPQAVIVALHGMSDYSQAFDLPGPWWAAHGISVYAYDQRGFGAAPDPGIWAGADAMRNDLDDCVDALRVKFPGVPVYALGESMGGSVVMTAIASAHPPRVKGIILVAPAVWSRDDMPALYRIVLWAGAHTFPGMHVSGEGLHILATNNFPLLRKLSRDPLYQHSARVDQVYGLVNLMSEAREVPQHLVASPPILLLYGGNDQVIPASPTQAVISDLGPKATVIRYPDGYHMLLRDLEGPARWDDVLKWVHKTNAAKTETAMR